MISITNRLTHDFLNKKRDISNFREFKDQNGDSKKTNLFDKLTKSFNNNNLKHSSDLIPNKVEFKLSYIIQGGEIKNISKSEGVVIEQKSQTNIKPIVLEDNSSFIQLFKKPVLKDRKYGKGLNNVGNTCFLNSTLQALFHTTPFVNYFLYSQHSKNCKLSQKDLCMLCKFEISIKQTFNSMDKGNSSFTPSSIIQSIKSISKHLRIGRQEDSHEFLIKLLESLESSYKKNEELILDSFIKDNNKAANLINYCFTGQINSIVECGTCKYKSETKTEGNHISLDIINCDSIDKSFINFCKPDYLIKDNKYFCEKCKTKRDSTKKFVFKQCKLINLILLL